jgi:PAS domain S-box-containing protein
MRAPNGTASTRVQRLWRAAVLLCVLVILALAGSSAYDAWRSYRHAITATDRELGNLAVALSEQTAWSLQSVDLLLLDTARWYRFDSEAIPPERRDAALAARAAGVPQVRQVTIIDSEGNRRYASRDSPVPNHNASDRSYFIAQRDGTARGLFISEPLITRTEGRAAIVMSRRLEDDNGQFVGVVTAIVNLDDLKQLYQAVHLGTGGYIQLLRDDGTLLARNPPALAAIGQRFPELAALPENAPARLVNPIDGIEEFIAAARVRDTSLVVTVTRSAAVALQAWREETIRVAVRTVIFVLLGALTIAALSRQIRRAAAGEQALRESEERYSLAMEGANEGHWDWDVAADRLFLSPKMKMLYGQSAQSAFDTRTAWLSQIVIHPEDLPRFEAALKDHFEGRTPRYECEYRVRQLDGNWHWMLARGRCLRDSAGKMRFVGSASDVSAQRQAQAAKEQLESQLRQSQKMEAIGTLAGGIAHDFNNILGAIMGYGELAHQQSAAGSPMRRYLDNVMHAAERAKMLVEGILGFSRSGLGERAPVNVQSVIAETIELLHASLPAGISLESRIEAGNAAVMGDSTYLHQVAMNLCTNAIQAMDHGGVLRVVLERVELTEGRPLARGTLAPGSYVRFTVSDTGNGIPPEVIERMFDPFFTTKSIGGGTGLGLSLVHGIITELGGAIDVVTKTGDGTSFVVWLPIAGEIPIPAAEVTHTLPLGNGETVMIVDDERQLLALSEEIVAALGYEPVGFDSSSVALRAFQTDPGRFDAVLTDELMPDLIGTELAREIRRLRPRVPIVLISGYGGAQLNERAAQSGVNEVLHKPLHRRDVAESLARVLDGVH